MNQTQHNQIHPPKSSNIIGLPFLALLLVMVVAQNPDWSSNSLIWWGCVGIFIVIYFLVYDGKLIIDIKYTLWVLAFFGICAASFIWAANSSLVVNLLKSMVLHVAILLFLRPIMDEEVDVEQALKIILIAAVINVVWLLLNNQSMFEATVGENEIIDRLGTEGSWNANEVGMMAATAMLIAVYCWSREKNFIMRCVLIGVVALMAFVVLLSGSRKALLMVIMGFCGFVVLTAKGRRMRAIIISVLAVLGLYYVAIEVPFFYSIIGWRIEGFIASLTGAGDVDSSTEIRDLFVKDAIEAWKERPLLGHGLDCYRDVNTIKEGMYSHNNYTELLADLGVVGTVIYYGGFLYCLVGLLRLKVKDHLVWVLIVILLIQLVMDYGNVSYNSLMTKVMLMLAYATLTIKQRKARKSYVER